MGIISDHCDGCLTHCIVGQTVGASKVIPEGATFIKTIVWCKRVCDDRIRFGKIQEAEQLRKYVAYRRAEDRKRSAQIRNLGTVVRDLDDLSEKRSRQRP